LQIEIPQGKSFPQFPIKFTSSFKRVRRADSTPLPPAHHVYACDLCGRRHALINHAMRWLVVPFLVVLTITLGASYSSTLIYAFMGPWSATAVEHDGSVSQMQFGQNLPRPSWVPVYPGGWVVQSSKVTSAAMPGGFHSLELGTRASLDEVKRFYTSELTAAGFVVEDRGLMSLNPATAAMLGIAGALSAKRADTDDQIDIQIRTADGLIASRLLQIHWRKISETPVHAPHAGPPAPAGKS
jgi:hypothetical protein